MGNPVVSGTTIDTSWANPTMSDVAQSLTDSLSRDGDGGMLAPFKNVDGTQAAPGITFNLEPGSGFYRFGAGDFRAVISGNDAVRFRDDTINPPGEQNPFQLWDGADWVNVLTITYTGQLLFGDGTTGAPTYSFGDSPSSGMWSSAPDTLNWSVNGINMLALDTSALTVNTTLELAGGALPATTGLADGALRYNGAGGLALKVGGSWATIPAAAPANNGNLIEVAAPVTADGAALDGYYNYIDTRAGEIEINLPAGVAGMRWGYVDFYRTFSSQNCVLIPAGTDKIEDANENYLMNLQGASGVMRYTTARGWEDTGGMS